MSDMNLKSIYIKRFVILKLILLLMISNHSSELKDYPYAMIISWDNNLLKTCNSWERGNLSMENAFTFAQYRKFTDLENMLY